MTDLMRSRYLVIGDYPTSPFKVGDILTLVKVNGRWTYMSGAEPWKSVGKPTIKDPEKYPLVFRKLEWWEYRHPGEMPEFVKLNPENTAGGNEIFRVDLAIVSPDGMSIRVVGNPKLLEFAHCRYFLPATEQDYNNQSKPPGHARSSKSSRLRKGVQKNLPSNPRHNTD